MPHLSTWPIEMTFTAFLLGAGIIAWTGSRLANYGDRIADRTGLGEAITGTLFLGIVTSLPGLAASITAALQENAALAVSNAIGGIAIQTTFLAVADIAYTKANLEHAAASIANLLLSAMLITLLTLVLLGLAGPEVTIGHIHPMTIMLIAATAFGTWLIIKSRKEPMWQPKETRETVLDVPLESTQQENLTYLLTGFFLTALITLAAGAGIAHLAGIITEETGLSQTVVGALFLGVATSLPELVTTVAAVRQGSLTLAVSDIVGGNLFDVLFVAAADIAYLRGSIFHASKIGTPEIFFTALTILLNVTLLLGLLYRQRKGPANIGFESLLILLFYIVGFLTLAFLL